MKCMDGYSRGHGMWEGCGKLDALKSKSQLRRLWLETLRQSRSIQKMRRWAVIAENNEGQRLVSGDVEPRQIGRAQRNLPPRGDDAVDGLGAETRHPQQFLAAGAGDIER